MILARAESGDRDYTETGEVFVDRHGSWLHLNSEIHKGVHACYVQVNGIMYELGVDNYMDRWIRKYPGILSMGRFSS